MLKKTGIIVAAVAAGVIGLTSMAFATTEHHDPKVDYTNIEDGNVSNDCEFAQTGPAIDAPAQGGDSLLLAGGAAANVIAPITAPIQALNCTNLNVTDVVDNNSNNTTRTATSTDIDDSNNSSTDGE